MKLSSGESLEADFCVFGIGVEPETSLLKGLEVGLCEEGGVLVNTQMQSVTHPWLWGSKLLNSILNAKI